VIRKSNFENGGRGKKSILNPLSSEIEAYSSPVGLFGGLLRADLGAHENNVGDTEADCHQAEQGRDVRPD